MKVEYVILSKLIAQLDFPCFDYAENNKVVIKKCGKGENARPNKQWNKMNSSALVLFVYAFFSL